MFSLVCVILVAGACSDAPNTSEIDGIETNDGGIVIKPPDVLDGETVILDGVDPTTTPTATAAVDPTDIELDAEARPPAPDADFVWFDGSPGSIRELQGSPTVLNFWASSCPPCVAEMPEFEEVYQELRDQVAFVGMNTGDRREAAERLVEQTGVSYPLAEDGDNTVFRSFQGFVMPTTVFIDADGGVAFAWAGVLTGDELRRLIDQHLAPGTYQDD